MLPFIYEHLILYLLSTLPNMGAFTVIISRLKRWKFSVSDLFEVSNWFFHLALSKAIRILESNLVNRGKFWWNFYVLTDFEWLIWQINSIILAIIQNFSRCVWNGGLVVWKSYFASNFKDCLKIYSKKNRQSKEKYQKECTVTEINNNVAKINLAQPKEW